MKGSGGLTPAQLRALRLQLPAFGEAAVPSPELQSFCQYYGIDFTARMPQVEYLAGRVNSGDFVLAVHHWRQSDASANLLLLHGYFDHTGLFGKLIEWALSRRCNVLIFDLPGHGLSSGEPAVIDDFGDYSLAIKDVLGAVRLPQLPLWVMAQSTGGAALVDFARKYDWPFAATVLLAPLIRPAAWVGVRAGYLLLGRFVDSVPRKFSVNSTDRDFLEFLQRDPLQSQRISLRWVGALRRWLRDLPRHDLGVGPALIIQGDADGTVDWRFNVGFVCKLFPDSRVEYIHGAGHQLANEASDNRRDYLGRVTVWLAGRGIALGAAPDQV
ncbi:MAG: alpha/beta hydrolase [Halioglobus sp.]